MHGASVQLRHCKFTIAQIALVASGQGTCATLRECVVASCMCGVIVEAGATLLAHSTRFDDAFRAAHVHGDSAVKCMREQTRAEFDDCDISCKPTARVSVDDQEAGGANGLKASNACVRLRRCGMTRYKGGMHADGATMEVSRCALSECVMGITAAGPSRVAARDVYIRADAVASSGPSTVDAGDVEGSAAAFVVRGMTSRGHNANRRPEPGRSMAQVERCDMLGSGTTGMHVDTAARAAVALCRVLCDTSGVTAATAGTAVTLRQCQIAGTGRALSVRHAGCSMRAHACVVKGIKCAIWAWGGSTTLVDTTVRGTYGKVLDGLVAALEGADVRLLRCAVSEGFAGVRAINSNVSAKDTRVSRIMTTSMSQVQHRGLQTVSGAGYVCQGGRLQVTGGCIENCVFGVAMADGHEGKLMHACVQLSGVTVRDYFTGVQTYDAACEFSAADCAFVAGECESQLQDTYDPHPCGEEWNPAERKVGVSLFPARRGAFERCTFASHWVDVVVDSVEPVRVSECAFRDAALRSSCITVRTDAVIENCRFHNVVQGVLVDRGVKVEVQGCEFRDVSISALTCEAGAVHAVVTVAECKIVRCDRGVWVKDGAAVTIRDSTMEDTLSGVPITGEGCRCNLDRVVMKRSGNAVRAEGGGADMPEVHATDCLFSEMSAEAVSFLSARGSLTRCRIDGAVVGVWVEWAGSACMHDCAVDRCKIGVMVSDFEEVLEDKCERCGVAGADSLAAAWRMHEAHARGTAQGRAGARCAHEGALAKLLMDDVRIAKSESDGVFVGSFGYLNARGVHVSGGVGDAVGFRLHRLVRASRFQNCSVRFDGKRGSAVFAGMHAGPEEQFTTFAELEPIPGIQIIDESSPSCVGADSG